MDKWQCEGNLFTGSICPSGTKKYFQLRCRDCEPCLKYRSAFIIATGIQRMEALENQSVFGVPEKIYHWVLGTNWLSHTNQCLWDRALHSRSSQKQLTMKNSEFWRLKDCKPGCGLLKIRNVWKKFTQWVRNMTYHTDTWWDLGYRVVEVGKTGHRVHVHLLSFNEFPIKRLKKKWAELTSIKNPYVALVPDNCEKHRSSWNQRMSWVKTCDECRYYSVDPVRSFGYLAKYLTKSLGRYYWLGRLNKVKLMPRQKIGGCDCCGYDYLKLWKVAPEEELIEYLERYDGTLITVQPFDEYY